MSLFSEFSIRPKPIRFVKKFLVELSKAYEFKPYVLRNQPVVEYGWWSSARLGICFYEDGTEVGHLSVYITKNTMHIFGFGRRNNHNLKIRDGRMTKILYAFLDGLVEAGLNEITMTDVSNGYWHYVAKKYPTIAWNGIVSVRRADAS